VNILSPEQELDLTAKLHKENGMTGVRSFLEARKDLCKSSAEDYDIEVRTQMLEEAGDDREGFVMNDQSQWVRRVNVV